MYEQTVKRSMFNVLNYIYNKVVFVCIVVSVFNLYV